jgi:hypothetical protein
MVKFMKANLKEKIFVVTIQEELEYIRIQNGGLLDPVKVVAYARNSETALHHKFEWDDSVAAEQYRIWQARKIISLELTIVQGIKSESVSIRTYSSLSDDRRGEEARGYRLSMDILSDEDLTQRLLEEARQEMRLFRRKYEKLKELSKVFEAMDSLL